MSVVEAMAHRLPVVASRVGGMTEIVQDCQTGLLVEAGDSAALANALLKLLDDEDRCREIGQTGYERARSLFSWDSIAQNLLAQYELLYKSQETLESAYSG